VRFWLWAAILECEQYCRIASYPKGRWRREARSGAWRRSGIGPLNTWPLTIAAGGWNTAKILFFIFLVLFVVSLVMRGVRRV